MSFPSTRLRAAVLAATICLFVSSGPVRGQDAPDQPLPVGAAPSDERADPSAEAPPLHIQPITGDAQAITGTPDAVSSDHPQRPIHVQPTTGVSDPLSVGAAPSLRTAGPFDTAELDTAELDTAGRDADRGEAAPHDLAPDEPLSDGPPTLANRSAANADGPVGTPDRYVVAGDQTLDVAAPGFLVNDIDLDGEAITATAILDNVDNGTLAAFADGRFTYTPDDGFTGTDSFTYQFRDASFNVSAPVPVTIEVVAPANRDPIGTADAYSMLAGTTLSIDAPGFLANDVDLDGEALQATVITDGVDNGTLAAFADGRFTYTPDAGFTGTDSFSYGFRDESFNTGGPVTVTIDVYEGNRAPIGVDDAYAAVINTTLTVDAPGFLGNDVDLDGEALQATVITDGVDNGTLSAFADGRFTYTPDAGFTGTDSFSYGFRDESFNTGGPVTVTIEVFDEGTTPVGMPDNYAMANDQTLDIAAPGFLGNDIDLDGEALTATTIADNVDHGTLAAFADGRFTYTPDEGFTGTDSFTYQFRDASFNSAGPVTVTIEVLPPANRDPIGTPDAYAMLAGTTLSIDAPGFLGNDVDLDGEALTATVIVDGVDNGTLAAFATGHFTYTPDDGFSGTDSFSYQFRDESFNDSEPVTVTIDVYEANRAPIGVEDTYAVLMDTPLSIDAPGFLMNDLDLDGEALTATAITDGVDHGTLAAFADGRFTYTPESGFSGVDGFTYQFRDESLNFGGPVAVTLVVIDPAAAPPLVDVTAPACELQAVNPGPPTNVDVFVGDFESGIASIEVLANRNATVEIPKGSGSFFDEGEVVTFDPPERASFLVHGVKVDASRGATVTIRVSDAAGNASTCDPVVATVVAEAPRDFRLEPNYPNPFNPTTVVPFGLPESAHVRLTVYDALGREVARLVDEDLSAGTYEITWDGRNGAGQLLPSGVYLYRIEAGTHVQQRVMTLLK